VNIVNSIHRHEWLKPAGLGLIFVVAVVLTVARGQDSATNAKAKNAKTPNNARSKNDANSVVKSRPQESLVLEFVAKNHGELSPLLQSLKKRQPQQYARAVRELSRVEQRLSSIRDRDEDRYALELKIWQVKSRAEVVAAKLAVSASDELRSQLEKLVAQNLRLRVQLLRRDRRKQQDRLKKLNEQIENFSSPEAIDRQVKILTRSGRTTESPGKRNNVTRNGQASDPKATLNTTTKKTMTKKTTDGNAKLPKSDSEKKKPKQSKK
jgi:hypothetical protein